MTAAWPGRRFGGMAKTESCADKLRAGLHEATDHGAKPEVDRWLALAVLIVTDGWVSASPDDRALAKCVLQTWGRSPVDQRTG